MLSMTSRLYSWSSTMSARVVAAGRGGRLGRRAVGRRRVHRQRHLEPEGRALARRAREADGAAHLLGVGAADRQAEAGAADLLLLRPPAAVEFLKEPALFVVGDAGAVVAHLDGDLHRVAELAAGLDADLDDAAARVLEGVGDVIDDDLLDLRLVAHDQLGQPGADLRDDQHLLLLRLPGEDRADVGEHAAQAAGLGVNRDAAGLDLGEVEHVLDQGGEVFRAFAQRNGHVALLGAEGGLLQQAREPDDAVERVADLVAHVGDEVGLGRVGAREFLGAAAHQRLELPVARLHLGQAEAVAAVDAAGGGEREQGVGPRRAIPRRQDEEGVRGRLAPPALRVRGAHLEGVGALAQVGELAEILGVGRRPVAVETHQLRFVAHILGVAVGGGGELEFEMVARIGQARGLGGQQREPGLACGGKAVRLAQERVEGRVQVLECGEVHPQEGFGAADPKHGLARRFLLIIEHGGRPGARQVR